MQISSKELKDLPELSEPKQDIEQEYKVEYDLDRMKEVSTTSYNKIISLAETAKDKGNPPHFSRDAFLIHMMIPDGHHRGIIMLVKTNGYSLPSDNLIRGPLRGG